MRAFQRLLNWTVPTGLLFISTAAWANPLPGDLWFDEYGVGYYWTQRLPSSVGMDPTGGVYEPVLTYQLPFLLQPTPGDVVLTNPDGSWSDVIRFALLGSQPGSPGTPVVIYYSNESDGLRLLPADVHSMPQLMPNLVTLSELAVGVTWYAPKVNEPGYYPTFQGPLYAFYGDKHSYNASDGGITALLLGIGLAGTHFVRRVKAWNTSRKCGR